MKEPKIDVRVPFEPEGGLGFDYNRIMQETKQDHVLFIDHDVLLATNLHWYLLCQKAIINNPKAALFTCYTNNAGCVYQFHRKSPRDLDIIKHKKFAKYVLETYQYECELVPIDDKIKPGTLISGFFMLVSKKAWEMVGGFAAKGVWGEDHIFHKRLIKHKLPVYVIKGLYCFHLRDRSDDTWIKDDLVVADYIKAKRGLK